MLLAAGLAARRARRALLARARARYAPGTSTALVAYLLLLAGLAAKIGWAPVHNWLPDAHSRGARARSRALLSAALLPAVLLVAWRSEQALAPAIGARTARVGRWSASGSLSLAVAVPFLWRPLPWKRLLAYSSLEHMGVIALGIGFGTPLALAGVAVHIAGHALAKALGFYAATPLLGARAARRRPRRRAASPARSPALGAAMGISLGALAGLPPSPLFVSEVLIVAGGFQAGRPWAAAAAAVLLALGFLGLAHALIETTVGKAHRRDRGAAPGLRGVTRAHRRLGRLPARRSTAAAFWLPGQRASSTRARAGARRMSDAYRDADRRRARRRLALRRPARHRRRALVRALLVAPDGATRLETRRRRERRVPIDRRPRAGRRLGRARGRRPLRRRASPATSRCARSSTTTSSSTAGPSRCAATTPTRSRSGRSTPA